LYKIIDKKYIYKSILKQSKKLNISKKEIKNAYFKANIINKNTKKRIELKGTMN
jgi:dimeric dUTPase (all-alpha-NTP-PPase superfamily)